MAILHFRCKERRRTLRVALTVPIIVHGQADDGEKFRARVHSRAVNRNGALLQMDNTHSRAVNLDQVVVTGQTLMLLNENTNRTAESRVVSVKHERDGKTLVAVEFTTPDANFWQMTFPIPGARPLRRPIASKVSA